MGAEVPEGGRSVATPAAIVATVVVPVAAPVTAIMATVMAAVVAVIAAAIASSIGPHHDHGRRRDNSRADDDRAMPHMAVADGRNDAATQGGHRQDGDKNEFFHGELRHDDSNPHSTSGAHASRRPADEVW
jgi:hypothetical protein